MRNLLVQNAGKPGSAMADDGLAPGWSTDRSIVQTLSGAFPMQAVVILLGTNDWNVSTPVATFESAYSMFIAAVPSGVRIVCVTPIWRRDDGRQNSVGETLDDVRDAVNRACAGRTVVDGSQAIPHVDRFFQKDGLHPNALGNRYLARAVAAALATLPDLPAFSHGPGHRRPSGGRAGRRGEAPEEWKLCLGGFSAGSERARRAHPTPRAGAEGGVMGTSARTTSRALAPSCASSSTCTTVSRGLRGVRRGTAVSRRATTAARGPIS